jgi:putative acetyltransferase
MITIRYEKPEDILQVYEINAQAFETEAEANLVDQLRENCPDIISLVAEDGDHLVGHILFSPMEIESQGSKVAGMGLAPLAVIPGHQNQGIGSMLVNCGLEILRGQGCLYVIVLGHRNYYPRFGFEPASHFDLKCQWDGVPDDAFMVIIFDETGMLGINGIARYREEFDDLA